MVCDEGAMFFVHEVKHGRGMAALSWGKTEVSRGGGRRW